MHDLVNVINVLNVVGTEVRTAILLYKNICRILEGGDEFTLK
jgi:hypothetical protein|tara:strand:+ start:2209 stop:2334 length:126 start_codon:yes stop_codon:yes gene_type:complete